MSRKKAFIRWRKRREFSNLLNTPTVHISVKSIEELTFADLWNVKKGSAFYVIQFTGYEYKYEEYVFAVLILRPVRWGSC